MNIFLNGIIELFLKITEMHKLFIFHSLVSFDPSIGTEIRKTRPAVIISGTAFNQRSKELCYR